jgi:hypothetical protein
VERTGGLMTSLGRLVARSEQPAVLAPGARAGLAVPGGLLPTREGRRRLHARLSLALAIDPQEEPVEIELASPWFEVDVGP